MCNNAKKRVISRFILHGSMLVTVDDDTSDALVSEPLKDFIVSYALRSSNSSTRGKVWRLLQLVDYSLLLLRHRME